MDSYGRNTTRSATHASIPRSNATPYYDCDDSSGTVKGDGIYNAQPVTGQRSGSQRSDIRNLFVGFDGPNDYDGDLSSSHAEEAELSDEVPHSIASAPERGHRISRTSIASRTPDQPLRHRRTPISSVMRSTKASLSRAKVTKAQSKPVIQAPEDTGNAGDIESGPSPVKPRLSISQKLSRSFGARRGRRPSFTEAGDGTITQGFAENGLTMTRTHLPQTPRSEPSEQTVFRTEDFISRRANGSDNGIAPSTVMEKVEEDVEELDAEKPEVDYKNESQHPRNSIDTRRSMASTERIDKQRFVILLCRALMLTGAPTHRLEEYMRRLTNILGLEAQFLYLPGCMIASFGDSTSHTSEMQIIRSAQGIDVTKFENIYRVYKDVVHDNMEVDEAFRTLDYIVKAKATYPIWAMIALYGIATMLVSVFAFEARFVDMPICGLFGAFLGYLQLVVAPKSELYTNVFEILAAIVSSFLARALGSYGGGNTFCFSAISQSAIALILPGWAILCGALEIQSKNIIAGSIRIFHAMVYSLFLGFGVSIGTALYGWIDASATSTMTCRVDNYGPDIKTFVNSIFVLSFVFCLTLINMTTKKTDIAAMVAIAFMGYFAQDRTLVLAARNPQIANCVGAFVVGILGNLYSRVFKGMAFTAMLPGILLQVPSGLSSRGSILAGIQIANDLVNNTVRPVELQYDSAAYAMGISMVQIAIGITVGLFMSALVVYPWGKKKTLVFSF